MPGIAAGPHDVGGGHRTAAYLVAFGLVVLFFAIGIVVATTLTGSDATSQARAEKVRRLPVHWTVHTGDSYQSIARRTGLTTDELERFNPYVNPDTIQPGQRLQLRARVPRGKPKPPGPRFYTVRRGDTFASIARKTDHSMSHLLQINPKLKPESLRPGQRMRLRRSAAR